MRYQRTLKAILDEIDKTERAALAQIETAPAERKRAIRRREDERWQWIVLRATDTAVKAVSQSDLLLGRES